MTPIRANILANYAGSFWTSLMSIIFIPVYIKFMGIESYALVGVFASLLALFSVLDLGLSATMTREMARLSALDPTGRDARGLARTLEVLYWAVALLLGLGVIALAGPIADHWVKPDRLEPSVVKQALMITGGIVALRWPVAFYSGGLRGLDRQPLLNLVVSVCATVRGLGSVAVLWLISPTIQAFFLFQIITSAVETSCLTGALWWSLPGRNTQATFSLGHLKRVWRFSAGMTGITVVVLLLTQTDKIILSKMLTLEQFGYYNLAWTVSYVILRFIDPIDAAVYPTLNRLVAERNEKELRRLYHKSCQIETVLLVPASLILVLFSDMVLAVWSGDSGIVQNTGPILSILAVGTCLNGFMHIPYLTQLAHGWTSLSFWKNVLAVSVLVPLMIVLASQYGGVGAAYVWVLLNACYVLIEIPVMHSRILRGANWDWYIYDIGLPTAASLAVAVTGWMVTPPNLPTPSLALYVVTVGASCCVAAAAVAPTPRIWLIGLSRNTFRAAQSWLSSYGLEHQ